MDQKAADATESLLREIFAVTDKPPCPLCGAGMDPKPVRNALSRLDNKTYICSTCGMREAAAPQRALTGVQQDTCLYRDDVMGIAIVVGSESGYTPWLPKPASTEFADGYVDAWNAKLGITKAMQTDIVAQSMFGDE